MKELRRHDDFVWIDRLQTDPESTLNELYNKFQGELKQWLQVHYGLNTEEAKDVFQDSILALYQNVRQGKLNELTSSLKTYLFSIAKNQAISYLRKFRKEVPLDAELHERNTDRLTATDYFIQESSGQDDRLALIGSLLGKMQEPCSSIITSFYFHKQSMEQIARQLNYSNANVAKAQKYRCMSKFLTYIRKSE